MKMIATVVWSLVVLATAFLPVVHAEEKKVSADAEFLGKVVPGIAASVKIIEYAEMHASDDKVKEFAKEVHKQHEGSLKTASEHAMRLKVKATADGEKGSKETIDKLSKLKGSELDVAFLEWLVDIHKDTTVFDTEVKDGHDAELKAYAKGSIHHGNEHLEKARELLAKLKK